MVPEHVWKEEEDYLALVLGRIREEIKRLEAVVSHRNESVLDLRRHFWDEITVNVDDMDETLETLASIQQQSLVLKSQEQGLTHAANQLKKLENMKSSPYFGRIDFRADGESRAEPIYIGIGSLISDDTGEALVYDWRAPIAGLFYDYATGPARYETPVGPVAGEITLKRQYVIEDGKLISVFDTGLHIGDEMLRRMLDRHADDRMKSIVSTIQREQNQVIRDESRRVLIVQGAAGSGKTSAALQRIAYLLYKHRKTLDAGRMVLFTPNDIFQDYVSNVLPELGESNVPQSTFHEMTVHLLGPEFRVEHPYDHLERKLIAEEEHAGNREETGAEAALSGAQAHQREGLAQTPERRGTGAPDRKSLACLRAIDAYVDSLMEEGMLFAPMTAGKRVLVDAEEMRRYFYEELDGRTPRARFDAMKEWLADKVKAYRTKAERRFFARLVKEPQYIGTDEELLEMARLKAKKQAQKLMKWVREGRFVNRIAMYTRFLGDEAAAAKIASGEVPYEEAAALMYFFHKLGGIAPFTHIRHVLVDEVQDYYPMQIALMKHLFPRSRMTLLGDLNQSVFGASGLEDYGWFTECFGDEDVGMIRLTKSYRSTQDILDFCRNILPEGEPMEAYGRHGEKPSLHKFDRKEAMHEAIADRIRALQAEGMGSIAIICRTERDARAVCEQLKERIDLNLITRDTVKFNTAKPVVIPSYMAKGLEFDAVIVYEGSAARYARESDRKLLYTVCTRALHRLDIFYTGDPSPFLPA